MNRCDAATAGAVAAPRSLLDAPRQGSSLETLARLIQGYRATGVICAAAQLGVADLVDEAGTSAQELATRTNCRPDLMYRLLRALASLGIFEEAVTGRFVHTEASRLLQKNSEPSLHGFACLTGMVDLAIWQHLPYSLQSGKSAFEKVFGTSIFDYMRDHQEMRDAFDPAMAGFTEVAVDAVLDRFDFSPYPHVIDLGGGNGSFLRRILSRYPAMRGTVYDLPQAVKHALAAVRGTPLEGRLNGIGGSFLESVPSGADLYVLKTVLCDWPDDQVAIILSNVRRAIGAARLLIVDAVIPNGNGPSFAKLADLNMLVTTASRERTEDDFRELLAASGFDLVSSRPAHDWVGLVEAVPRADEARRPPAPKDPS